VALQFTIPGRPTAWQRAREFVHRQSGKIVRSNPPEMKVQQDAIRWAAKAAMGAAHPMTGPLRLEVLCVYRVPPSWPTWKQAAARLGKMWKTSVPDHDNLLKQVSDALNGYAYGDDAQIVQTSFGKRYGAPERTEVRLTEVAGLSDHSPKGACEDVLALARGQDSLPGLVGEARNTQTQGAA
jgi:Holliday junction resolvase RusA-like endonuclease